MVVGKQIANLRFDAACCSGLGPRIASRQANADGSQTKCILCVRCWKMCRRTGNVASMSLWTKPIEQISYSDVVDFFLANKTPEGVNLDYKEDVPSK